MRAFTAIAHLVPTASGFDVVEYFSLSSEEDGVMGSSDYASVLTTNVGGAGNAKVPANYTFYFKDAANKAKFETDPWSYAPRYGGF